MSAQVDPIANPQIWDTVTIGGFAWPPFYPGYCEVGEFKRAHEWDVKKGKGTIGGTVTFVGRPPAKGKITFWMWLPSHFVAWDTLRPLLKYDPTKASVQAVDIYHPSLADVDINSVVTESIGNVVHQGKQMYSVEVEFLEYFPPPKVSAVSTPTHAAANISRPVQGALPDAADVALQNQITSLLNQAQQP